VLLVRSVVVGPFQENCYLAACDRTGEAILVDPGDEAPRLLAMREPGAYRVTRILATHGHIDHVTAAEEVRTATGAPFSIHADDDAWLAALPRQAEMFGFPPVAQPTVDLHHADGDVVRVGDHRGRVIHTPGHTRGGCCLFFPDDGLLFCGDTLFSGSVGRTDLPGGDFDVLRASIVERIFTLGDDVRFLPGHGPGGRLGDERLSNPFVGERPPRGRFV
jgi:glyoxylase-like metal-dependent hydrolase (beta-lactamase superfamily II)